MRNRIYFQIFILSALFLGINACKMDLYELPNETLTGVIIDKNTGNPIQTE